MNIVKELLFLWLLICCVLLVIELLIVNNLDMFFRFKIGLFFYILIIICIIYNLIKSW